MDKITSILENNTNEKSYFSLIFGNKTPEYFDFGFSEEKYLKFLRHIKNDDNWDLISKKNIKTFYYYDLKLTSDTVDITLEKDRILSYHDLTMDNGEGIRIMNCIREDNMDITIFPGLDKIHDIRKSREIIFKKDNITIKFLVVNHVNKDITFEVFIYTDHKYRKELLKKIPTFIEFFKLGKLTKYNKTKLENLDNLSLSVI